MKINYHLKKEIKNKIKEINANEKIQFWDHKIKMDRSDFPMELTWPIFGKIMASGYRRKN